MKDLTKAPGLYSEIFERPDDCKNHPFEFERQNLQDRRPDDEYPKLRMKGMLIMPL